MYRERRQLHEKHVQTDSEWQEEMSQKIIDEIQCELYLDMPFMKLALSALSPKVNEQLYSMATDGTYIYYNPIRLIDIFKKNRHVSEPGLSAQCAALSVFSPVD